MRRLHPRFVRISAQRPMLWRRKNTTHTPVFKLSRILLHFYIPSSILKQKRQTQSFANEQAARQALNLFDLAYWPSMANKKLCMSDAPKWQRQYSKVKFCFRPMYLSLLYKVRSSFNTQWSTNTMLEKLWHLLLVSAFSFEAFIRWWAFSRFTDDEKNIFFVFFSIFEHSKTQSFCKKGIFSKKKIQINKNGNKNF